jgi:F-type H+-transporting ATPase subunit delta
MRACAVAAPGVPSTFPAIRGRAGSRSTVPVPANRESPDVANDDPMLASVAGRYAAALFELATEQRALAEVEQGLNSFRRAYDESEDLRRLVNSPVFSAEDQANGLAAVLAKAGIGGLAASFLGVVARNRRLFAAPDMVEVYRALMARQRGEVAAEVASAHPLTEAQRTQLLDTLSASVGGKPVTLTEKVDASLLGGLIVKIGSRMIDSSLKTKLASLKTLMKEVR